MNNHAALQTMTPASAHSAPPARPALPRAYRFGSPELTALHDQAWEDSRVIRTLTGGAERAGDSWLYRSVPSYSRVIRWAFDGFQYIVDHGSFRTLNTMRAGHHAVQIDEI